MIDAVYRAESRCVLATLIRLLGGFELAEEALHAGVTEEPSIKSKGATDVAPSLTTRLVWLRGLNLLNTTLQLKPTGSTSDRARAPDRRS